MKQQTPWRGLALVALALALFAVWQGPALWRSVSPYLPARVQALPYQLAGSRGSPVPLPTAPRAAPTAERRDTAPAATAVPATAPVLPTAPPTALPSAPPTAPLPAAAQIAGVRHAYQRWNNCGPVTIAMQLSAFGDAVDQLAAAAVLKPDPDDKNVGPEELAAFARSRGYEATVRVNGDLDRLRVLLAAGLPVILETWFIPKPGDEMGHYRLAVGYDDAAGVVHTADSYEGPAIDVPYDELDRLWRAFNRSYVLAWPPDRRAEVERLLGDELDDGVMWVRAAAHARAELDAAPDAFGWFNLGSSLLGLGDTAAAAEAFDRAREIGLPWRMLWYQFGPFEAYAAQSRWQDVSALAAANLRNAGNLEESIYWRGRAHAAAGDAAAAAADYRRALDLNPGFTPAQLALVSGEP